LQRSARVFGVVIPDLLGDDGGSAARNGNQRGEPFTRKRDAQLEVVALVVRNRPDEERGQIEVAVRNIGDLVSVINRAEFWIRDFRDLDLCAVGAYLLPSAAYDLELPQFDAKGKTIFVDVSQVLRPNEADRFTFRVGLQEPPPVASTTTNLYQLRMRLYHDRAQTPLLAGTVAIALLFPDAGMFEGRGECQEQNRRDLEEVVSGNTVRSAELADLSPQVGAAAP